MWPSSEQRLQPVTGSPTFRYLRIQPTRLGVGLLVTVALLWLVGLQYQVNLAYAVAFWLLGFLAVATLLNIRQLLGLRLDIQMPSEIFAGSMVALGIVPQDNSRSRWLWLCHESDYLRQPKNAEIWQPWTVDAKEGGAFQWKVDAPLRGYLHIPVLRTASAAPFGVSLVQCAWQWTDEMVVFPQPLPHAPEVLAVPDGEEDTSRPPLLGGEEPAYLQAHQDGMPLHHIAWKSYAKTGQLLDKRFETPQQAVRSMVISYRDYQQGTGKDKLAGLLCHRVLEAERSSLPYILELPQRTIAPQKGQREVALTALALM